jgi:hypothetical protein
MSDSPPNGLESSPALDKLLPALLEVQREIAPAKKTALNPHFKTRYADLAEIWDTCSGPLQEHGFVVLNPIAGQRISCILAHQSGQWIRSWLEIPTTKKLATPLNAEPVPLTPQDLGGVITYYRRYLLSALLAIVTEDDDANAASGRARETNGHARQPRPANGREPGPATKPAPEGPRETWAAWIARTVRTANDNWRNEQMMEGIAQEDAVDLVNQHQVLNEVCTRAITAGLIDAGAIATPAGKRDRAKTLEAVSRLFAARPRGVQKTVEGYLTEKRNELRAKSGLPNPDADEVLDHAQESAEDVSQDVRGGREPGEEG